jgi:hypothetical protein
MSTVIATKYLTSLLQHGIYADGSARGYICNGTCNQRTRETLQRHLVSHDKVYRSVYSSTNYVTKVNGYS